VIEDAMWVKCGEILFEILKRMQDGFKEILHEFLFTG